MKFENKSEFLNSLIKKEDVVKQALTKLYQGVRATNEFLGLKNSQELQSTYYKLRIEEVSELFTAIDNVDKVEFLDAVVDGLVVVGYEYFLNYDLYPELTPVSHKVYRTKYILNKIFKYYETEIMCGLTLGWLEELFNQLDIDHMKSVDEVLESNMSKFPTVTELWSSSDLTGGFSFGEYTKGDLFNFECNKIENQGRYIDVYHEIRYDESIQDDRVIFWAKGEKQPDGSIKEFKAPKYVKPCTFKEPDFASCWNN